MANRLAGETSPYLRSHADNPVDWYPWGDEAFERARGEDLPLFVSIGYSACHWCHVMAHESFEDGETAKLINESFVAVKVDREERPDVDAVYMEATQVMTGGGGWPMSVFCAPDGRPFFAGTYHPKRAAHGMPSFTSVLRAVEDAWRNRRSELMEQAALVHQAIAERLSAPRGPAGSRPPFSDGAVGDIGPQTLTTAREAVAALFDARHGGFGRAPKFPQPAMIELLLRCWAHDADTAARDMAVASLDAMAAGGIYDQLGGGFARYSVDGAWLVPHFEKMLYDQAGLSRAYVHSWCATGNAEHLRVAEETVGYVLRDLALPGGGICSSEDADSEGSEGRFYLWTRAELDEVLGPAGGAEAAEHFGVTAEGNFAGANILNRARRGAIIRPEHLQALCGALLAHRATRVRPARDTKVLTEWNAMFLSSLCEAATATGRADWRHAAVQLGDFLLAHLRRGDGRWMRSWKDGQARHLACAADYAWLVDAFTRLGELSGAARWTAEAVQVAEAMRELFRAPDGGGALLQTGNDAERLVVRSADMVDGAVASASSVAALALLRLEGLTGRDDLGDSARAILAAAVPVLAAQPRALLKMTEALDVQVRGLREIAVVGARPDLVEVVHRRWMPDAVLAWGEPAGSPLLEGRKAGLAYVCRSFTCRAPVSEPDALAAQLDAASRAGV